MGNNTNTTQEGYGEPGFHIKKFSKVDNSNEKKKLKSF
jgi:hypothetical protein